MRKGLIAACLLVIVLGFGVSLNVESVSEPVMTGGAIALYAGMLVAMIWVDIARFNNLGMSGWWILGLFVPFLNIWLKWRQFACPEGYANHRQLDTIDHL